MTVSCEKEEVKMQGCSFIAPSAQQLGGAEPGSARKWATIQILTI